MPKIRSASGRVHRAPGALLAVAVVLSAWVAPITAGGLGEPCAAAAGQVRVWLVVDFGNVPGSPGGVRTMCVSVPDGSSGSAVVIAGLGGVRWSSSGLLCSIGNYPAGPECGDRTPAGYRYWSYWHGGSSWTYSGLGPDGVRVHDGDVEGWHFVSGKGNPTDPAPGASPANGCPPPITSPPPTNAPTRPTVPTTQPSRPGGGSSGPSSGGGTNSGGSAGNGSAGGGGGSNGPAANGAGGAGAAGAVGNTGAASNGGGDVSSTTAADGSSPSESADPTAPDAADGNAANADGGAPAEEARSEAALAPSDAGTGNEQAAPLTTPASTSAPASSTLGLFVGLSLIALIGGGAYVQFRRRPSLL